MAAFELLKCLKAGNMVESASWTAIRVSGSSYNNKFVFVYFIKQVEFEKKKYRFHSVKEHLNNLHIFGDCFW